MPPQSSNLFHRLPTRRHPGQRHPQLFRQARRRHRTCRMGRAARPQRPRHFHAQPGRGSTNAGPTLRPHRKRYFEPGRACRHQLFCIQRDPGRRPVPHPLPRGRMGPQRNPRQRRRFRLVNRGRTSRWKSNGRNSWSATPPCVVRVILATWPPCSFILCLPALPITPRASPCTSTAASTPTRK